MSFPESLATVVRPSKLPAALGRRLEGLKTALKCTWDSSWEGLNADVDALSS